MKILQAILMGCVWCYQRVVSPAKSVFFGPMGHCRFSPTCSAYAMEALKVHGALFGACLTVKRMCRCHPWGGCGHDPVPQGAFHEPEGRLYSRPLFRRLESRRSRFIVRAHSLDDVEAPQEFLIPNGP